MLDWGMPALIGLLVALGVVKWNSRWWRAQLRESEDYWKARILEHEAYWKNEVRKASELPPKEAA